MTCMENSVVGSLILENFKAHKTREGTEDADVIGFYICV